MPATRGRSCSDVEKRLTTILGGSMKPKAKLVGSGGSITCDSRYHETARKRFLGEGIFVLRIHIVLLYLLFFSCTINFIHSFIHSIRLLVMVAPTVRKKVVNGEKVLSSFSSSPLYPLLFSLPSSSSSFSVPSHPPLLPLPPLLQLPSTL